MSPGLTQQLAPDQERRLRQQHKKRTAELGKAQKDGKEADLLSTLQAQAQRCEKAQREAANAEKVAAGGLAAIEAELGSARKKSSVLEALEEGFALWRLDPAKYDPKETATFAAGRCTRRGRRRR